MFIDTILFQTLKMIYKAFIFISIFEDQINYCIDFLVGDFNDDYKILLIKYNT